MTQGFRHGVQQCGGELACLLRREHDRASRLDVVRHAGHVVVGLPVKTLDRAHGLVGHRLAGLSRETLMILEMLDLVTRLANGLDDGGMLVVPPVELLVVWRTVCELHEPVVMGDDTIAFSSPSKILLRFHFERRRRVFPRCRQAHRWSPPE